jgi:type II secretory ATPase GspE/PulE/Tfp pilus assembly ATPase PilB-like protein
VLIALADTFNLPYIELKGAPIEEEAVKRIPVKYALYYKIMPIKIEDGRIVCAISDPLSAARVIDDINIHLNYKLELVLSQESQIVEAIKQFYGIGAETMGRILSEEGNDAAKELSVSLDKEEDVAKLAGDASVIKLVNQILIEAQEKGATDIHIEPYQGKLKLRYRIDGILYDTKVPSDIIYLLPAIISRVKIMAALNVVERRIPQDGRAKVKINDEVFDLRISTLPTSYGESMVIRILPVRMLFGLEELGFQERDLKILGELIKKPHGTIFVTGPTGSGKTTTLYTCLSKIKKENPGAKILTIEDPIEYELEGITQIQVNPAINITFATGLRSMLRHDPDIMMVGEVRDFETAEIAIRMALTGHLLFSTLHTNDAATSAMRLLDMGVEPYLVASSVESFIAQRLVRLICQDCKEEYAVPHSQSMELKAAYRGLGCEACNSTGYKGRTVVYEMLLVSEKIKGLIQRKASSDEINKQAVLEGMKTLYQCGIDKVAKGITTFEEVLRVTQAGS